MIIPQILNVTWFPNSSNHRSYIQMNPIQTALQFLYL